MRGRTSILHLRLDFNNFGDDGAAELVKMAASHATLMTFSILGLFTLSAQPYYFNLNCNIGCPITDNSIKCITEVYQLAASLETFAISTAGLSESGLATICDMCCTCVRPISTLILESLDKRKHLPCVQTLLNYKRSCKLIISR